MKKNPESRIQVQIRDMQIFKIMRLSAILFFFSMTAAFATDIHSQSTRIDISAESESLSEVLDEIEQRTDYLFIYDQGVNTDIEVSVNADNATISEIMSELLDNTGISYEIDGFHIILSNENKLSAPQSDSRNDSKNTGAKVTGKIVDEKGEPLPGVAVIVKASSIGAMTDIDGNFELSVPNNDVTLIFSSLGFMTQELSLSGASMPLRIMMREDNEILEEVVVVGYGTQKKLSVTSAVSSVKTENIVQSPVANISSALAGRLPGLVTLQYSGEPGADNANLWIRGQATYNGSTSPLILVDGIERDMNDIDPNEIEDVTILKDASATAVYGIRGANGVVLVTTKRGEIDKATVSFSYQHGIQTPTRVPDYLESYDALTLYAEGLRNDGLPVGIYTDDYIAKFKDRSKPAYEYMYPSVDWMDTMLKDASHMDQASLQVRGGGSVARYFVSVSYLNQDGIYNYEDSVEEYDFQARMQRYNFRSNIDMDLTKDLTMEVNIGAMFKNRNYPGEDASDIFYELKRTRPWDYPLMNPDGSNAGTLTNQDNPYVDLTQRGYKQMFNSTLNATLGFKLDMPWITEGLSARTRLSFDTSQYRYVTRTKTPPLYEFVIDPEDPDLSNGEYILRREGTAGGVLGYSVSANSSRKTLFEFFLNYDRTFGESHDVHALLLYNQGDEYMAVASGSSNAIKGLPYRRQGFAGRFNYSYDDRYFVEANFAWNGSEQFAKGHRFGFFPSGSFGWVLSNEPFFASAKQVVNLLKLRASVGMVGNDSYSSRFLYQSTWNSTGGYQFGQYQDGDSFGGIQESTTGNVETTWERATKYNVGFDLALWQNQLSLAVDGFYEYRTGILTSPKDIVSGVFGINAYPSINAGIVENRGFEVELTHQKTLGNHSYFIRGNYSYSKNNIIECLEPDMQGREWQSREGTSIGEKYGLIALGLFKDEEDIAKSPVQTFGPVQPGDIKYKDMNNDGKIDSMDEAYLGKSTVPTSMFGFSFGYSFKNFDVSVLFQGALGGVIFMEGETVWPFSKYAGVLADVKDNHFSAENPDPNAEWPRMVSNVNNNNYISSSFWMRSTDYIRLKNFEIGYSLPKKWMKKVNIQNARFYATGQNLFTIDKVKIFDPEISGDSGTYPQMRVFNFGISITY